MNYKWTCPDCGNNVIEEVMSDVTQSSSIDAIELLDDGSIAVDSGNVSCDGGDPESIYYQCQECGYEVSIDEMVDIAGQNKEE